MTRLLALLAALLLVSAPVAATENDALVIKDALDEAIAVMDDDPEAYAAVKAEVYALATSENTSPACRAYADLGLAALLLIDIKGEWPALTSIDVLWGIVIEYIPIATNDCRLAV